MLCRFRILLLVCSVMSVVAAADGADPLQPESDTSSSLLVGVAETDITPPVGFPMAGYYHERLAEGTIDPLKAKAIVFRDGDTAGALVVCDLIGIATDLSREVRRRASEKTGIPETNIAISATHSHTAPDYMKELYLYLGKEKQEELRATYIEKLINGPVEAIVQAHANAKPVVAGSRFSDTDDSGFLQPPIRDARRQRANVAELCQILKSSGRPVRSIRRSHCSRFVIRWTTRHAASSATLLCIWIRSAA